jgi:hypothetical protein
MNFMEWGSKSVSTETLTLRKGKERIHSLKANNFNSKWQGLICALLKMCTQLVHKRQAVSVCPSVLPHFISETTYTAWIKLDIWRLHGKLCSLILFRIGVRVKPRFNAINFVRKGTLFISLRYGLLFEVFPERQVSDEIPRIKEKHTRCGTVHGIRKRTGLTGSRHLTSLYCPVYLI